METPFQSAERYLKSIFDLDLSPKPVGARALPDYLRARYDLRLAGEGKRGLILMSPRAGDFSPLQLLKDAEQIDRRTGHSTVIVTQALSPYARGRLVQGRRGFVVPGLHAYLPSLLFDASETARLRPPPRRIETLSPSTQAIFLYFLYARSRTIEAVTSTTQRMPYSAMTLSRAVQEMEQAGMVVTETSGRKKCARFEHPWRELWSNALPYLRSPVRRRISVAKLPGHLPALPAGLSALASFSDLAEPRRPVYAARFVFNTTGPSSGQGLVQAEHADEAAAIIEQWSYAPLAESPAASTVDRLSLYLSLREDRDVRVQAALDKMLEDFFHA